MIIGIDASRANRPRKTGTEWYSFYLIKSFAAQDKTNKYWLYLDKSPTAELIAAVKENPNFSFKVLNWPFNFFWTLVRLTWEMLWKRPDVLFVPAHSLPLFFPRRTINTIHDVAFVRERSLYLSEKVRTQKKFSRRVINFFVKLFTFGRYSSESLDYLFWSTAFALRHAGKIITVSDFTKQEIISLYPQTKAAKIITIHNGYDVEGYQPLNQPEKTQEILNKYGLEAPYFLYAGRLDKKKNTPALIEALAILRESQPQIKEKLVLIGNAGYGYDEVKYMIEEFGLENDVFMPGWVNEEDLPYIFAAASAFIFPSKHEGFGIPVLQSLACGVPAAVSDIPVLREVASDAVLYFNQNDKQAIANTMIKIIGDQKLREELRAKGLARARQFSWEKCARETLKEIENW
jgi:glycosyltransferase involved in cell wall biosynthesis